MKRLILQRTFLDRTRSLLAWRCGRIKNHLKGSRQFSVCSCQWKRIGVWAFAQTPFRKYAASPPPKSSCRRVRLAGQGKARRASSRSVQELQTGRVETLFQLRVSRRDMRLHRFPERTRSFPAMNNPVHQKRSSEANSPDAFGAT